MRSLRKIAVMFALVGLAAAGLPQAPAAALTRSFSTYLHVTADDLATETARAQLAANYDMLIVRGRLLSSVTDDLRARKPGIKIYSYSRAGGMPQQHKDLLESTDPSMVAKDCNGNYVLVRREKATYLGDFTHPGFRTWFADAAANEVAFSGTDGTYLDTLGVFFSDAFYTARPCINGTQVTNTQWRDGSAEILKAVRAATGGKPVIANGFGLGSGAAYFSDRANADVVIAAADAVQIEGFTRWSGTGLTKYYSERRWGEDVEFLKVLGAKGKTAYAYTKVGVTATTADLERLRDYALGTFLLGMTPGNALFSFNDKATVPTTSSDPGWGTMLGAPTGEYHLSGKVRVRNYEGGKVAVNPTKNTLTFEGVSMPHHTALAKASSTSSSSGTGSTLTWSRTEDSSSSVAYSGSWRTKSTSKASGGTVRVSKSGTSSFSFDGTAVRLIGTRHPNGGIAQVVVDGTAVDVNTYAASTEWQAVVFSVTGLSSGRHTIEVRTTGRKDPASGGTLVFVDAYDVD